MDVHYIFKVPSFNTEIIKKNPETTIKKKEKLKIISDADTHVPSKLKTILTLFEEIIETKILTIIL